MVQNKMVHIAQTPFAATATVNSASIGYVVWISDPKKQPKLDLFKTGAKEI
jgi:hypothetical protein